MQNQPCKIAKIWFNSSIWEVYKVMLMPLDFVISVWNYVKFTRVFREGGGTFACFYPFACWLSVVYNACTPPWKYLFGVHFKERGVHAFFLAWFPVCYTHKNGKSVPLPLQTLAKKIALYLKGSAICKKIRKQAWDSLPLLYLRSSFAINSL